MDGRHLTFLLWAALVSLLVVSSPPANATLGGVPSATRPSARAQIKHENYTVQEMGSGANTVREFVSPSGQVFGLAWNGLSRPNLSQLLGSYFDEYQKAAKVAGRARGHRAHSLKSDNVVVEESGHMRALKGRAYVPALVPQGVSVDEIK